jgi:hypothetical protein
MSWSPKMIKRNSLMGDNRVLGGGRLFNWGSLGRNLTDLSFTMWQVVEPLGFMAKNSQKEYIWS